MPNVYFISDLHFGHDRITSFRPDFGSCSEEHDSILIDRINSKVGKRDKLYILGDIAFNKRGVEQFKRIQSRHVEAIWGNHCDIKRLAPLVEKWHAFKEYKEFWLSHCPIHPNELRGRVNIHGHVHNKTIDDERYISVCVEACNGYPLSIDEIRAKITNRDYK